MKNERTSKKVAKKASAVLENAGPTIAALEGISEVALEIVKYIKNAKSVAASALTQTPDKKKK